MHGGEDNAMMKTAYMILGSEREQMGSESRISSVFVWLLVVIA